MSIWLAFKCNNMRFFFLPPPQVEAISWCCQLSFVLPKCLNQWPPCYQAVLHFSSWASISALLPPCLGRWSWWWEMGRPGALHHGGDWHRVKEGVLLPLQPAHSSWRRGTKTQKKTNLREAFPWQIQPWRKRDLVFRKAATNHGSWWQLQRVRDVAVDERQVKAALSVEMRSCHLHCCQLRWSSLLFLYRAWAHRFLLGLSELPEW